MPFCSEAAADRGTGDLLTLIQCTNTSAVLVSCNANDVGLPPLRRFGRLRRPCLTGACVTGVSSGPGGPHKGLQRPASSSPSAVTATAATTISPPRETMVSKSSPPPTMCSRPGSTPSRTSSTPRSMPTRSRTASTAIVASVNNTSRILGQRAVDRRVHGSRREAYLSPTPTSATPGYGNRPQELRLRRRRNNWNNEVHSGGRCRRQPIEHGHQPRGVRPFTADYGSELPVHGNSDANRSCANFIDGKGLQPGRFPGFNIESR